MGDALGAPVEFLKHSEIRARYGPDGIRDFDSAYGRVGAITDDTQMTLFTAEGILRGICRWENRGIAHPASVIFNAYRRWLYTQTLTEPDFDESLLDGWLVKVRSLHSRRAPGRTCVTALQRAVAGSMENRINSSKGCGGVMRAAPAGLVAVDAFELGCESAALTHGHPSGYLSAGTLAEIVQRLVTGDTLHAAIASGLARLRSMPESEECIRAIERAVELAESGEPSGEKVHQLGGGWTGETALAIAIYATLTAPNDFAAGVRLAVNHDGDSDSTGAIAGNILGALLGEEAIPRGWLADLELRHEIEALADDLVTRYRETRDWWARYPGW